jgi:hypothetical protein
MSKSWFFPWRRCLLAFAGTLALLAGLGLTRGRSVAQTSGSDSGTTTATAVDPHDASNLVRVEEDWSLLVTTPNFNQAAPQVSTQMIRSPDAQRFCTFHINSCDIPTFNQGGLQIQAWEGSTNLAVGTSNNRNTMSTLNELVTWTQYLSRDDANNLRFGIGTIETPDSPNYWPTSSATWGDFSGGEVVVPESGTYLGNYTTDYSVNNSGITFGANRVASFLLVRVRKYYVNGDVDIDDTPRIIYSPDLDPNLNSGG